MKTNYILALLAVIGGVTAAFTSFSERNELYPTWKYESERVKGARINYISAPQLADRLYAKDPEIVLLDIRSEEDYLSYHLPTALPLIKTAMEGEEKTRSYVVYGQDEHAEIPKFMEEWSGQVYLLKGGLETWYSLVLFPDFAQHKVRNREALEHIIRRSRYFGGSPRNAQELHIEQRQSTYREGC
jgi:rhodanese-related sulfurtransferase